jgi:hypothetical protein
MLVIWFINGAVKGKLHKAVKWWCSFNKEDQAKFTVYYGEKLRLVPGQGQKNTTC